MNKIIKKIKILKYSVVKTHITIILVSCVLESKKKEEEENRKESGGEQKNNEWESRGKGKRKKREGEWI